MAHLQERKLRVAKRRYTKEFREFAVERLRGCENIVALARELQVSRRQLYRWRDELDPEIAGMEAPGQEARASTLRKEVNHLKRVLAEKTWRWIFSEVPCKKSRLDARRAAGLARRRHLQANRRDDAVARWLERRA